MFVVDAIGCEAIINGPLIDEDLLPWNQLSSLDINETNPARVRCQVTCLNQQGFYDPAMALIVTSQEEFIPILHYLDGVDTYSWNGLYFEIDYQNFSHNCDVHNNYTMEFEYLIYSNTSEIDRSVVTCGVKFRAHLYQNNDVCWGNMFGIIRYHGLGLVSIDVPPPVLTTNYDYIVSPPPTIPARRNVKAYHMEFIITIAILSAAVIVLVAVIIALVIAFLYCNSVKSHKRTTSDSRIEEQASPLVMKLEDISTAAQEEVKQEELQVDQCKVDDSSMTKDNLVHKIDLPDFISSQSND